jgi:signal transduction histidine kinase
MLVERDDAVVCAAYSCAVVRAGWLGGRIAGASPQARDRLLTAAVGTLAIAEWVSQLDGRYFPGYGSAFALLIPLTLLWRRAHPFGAMVAALLIFSLVEALAGVLNWTTVPVTLMLLSFAVGTSASTARRVLASVLCGAWATTLVAIDPSTSSVSGTALGAAFFLAAPTLLGRVLEIRAQAHAEERAAAGRMEHEQAQSARQAAAAERVRVARELHDVLAHSVSVMVIQTEAARAVAKADPCAAAEALRSVENAGREALIEMRRTVGVLRQDNGGAADGPTPGLADLRGLAERAREAGLPVEVAVLGRPTKLPAGLELVGYRVAQEAITNAIKHAGPATARVEVEYAPEALRIDVTDTGHGPAAGDAGDCGHGLLGMRERVSLYGGTLLTGPVHPRGFAVRASIPLAEAGS